ncbi:MAG: V-type ATPase subunit [Candidatus Brocadiales bacterium]
MVSKVEGRDPSQWCYISGRVNALETALLSADFFKKFIYLERREDMLSCIRDSSLREYFHTTDDITDFEDIINRRSLSLIQEIKRFSPSPVVCDFFQLPYDFMNLKSFLKENIHGLRPTKRFPSPVGDDVWGDLWEGKKPPLPRVYEEAVSTLKSHAKDKEAKAVTPGLIDVVLDGHLLYNLPVLVAEMRSELIQGYVRDYLRLKGILMLQRVPAGHEVAALWFFKGDEFFERFLSGPPRHWKEALLEIVPERVVEGIITGNRKDLLSRYERHASDYLMERLEPARYMVFGPERVFGYLAGLTTELFNLRLLIGGKINKLSPQVIEGMLRRTYI